MALALQFTRCVPNGALNFTCNLNPAEFLPGSVVTFINPAAPLPPTVYGCYTVTLAVIITPPDYIIDWNTQQYITPDGCDECTDLIRFNRQLQFTACCDPTDVHIFRADDVILDGTYAYYGLEPNGLKNHHCYQVENMEITDFEYFYSLPPIQATDISEDDCESETCQNACNTCFMLEDCEGLLDPIYTTSEQFLPLVDTNIAVKVNGYDACWTVTTTTTNCDCAISLIPVLQYKGCVECLNVKGYKLTSCADPEHIIYSVEDLTQYVDKVIRTDCGTCWIVQEIDIYPPDTQPIVIVSSYETCKDCTAVHYQLTDCTGQLDPIYTTVDLSEYLNKVITLEYCPQVCWRVLLAEDELNTGTVYPSLEFNNCPQCYAAVIPVTCQSANNALSTPQTVGYTNSSGIRQNITLQAGESTGKLCILFWDPAAELTDIKVYGECIEGECPPIDLGPRRKVKPGYDTKACTPEYYEEVMCNYAEWMYKDVMEKRYGISNCCPDELMKWEIRKEMLDLDVLIDPDYTCLPATNCGCCSPSITHPTGGCGS